MRYVRWRVTHGSVRGSKEEYHYAAYPLSWSWRPGHEDGQPYRWQRLFLGRTLCARFPLANGLAALDGTELAFAHVGSIAGLSVALGAATCKLVGLSPAAMEHAVREELAALGLNDARIAENVGLAYIAYEQLTVLPAREELGGTVSPAGTLPQPTVVTPTYQGALRGAPSVVAPANTPLRKTGNWRVWWPVIDLSRCSQCWVCFVSCPEGAIALDEGDNPHIDYDVCKGCLICVEECPTHTIHQVRESEV